jgi:DUF4097 and DUF4098 domain-containing protein YvlB
MKLSPSLKFVIALLVSTISISAVAQDFTKSFKVLADGTLDVVTKSGSVTVVPAEGNLIQISARRSQATVNATQSSPQGNVKVEVTDAAPVELTIGVPASTSVNIVCLKCAVIVRGIRGAITASTTEGNIQLTGIRSNRVEARSMSGNVSYDGDVAAGGSYFLKSFSGQVDSYFPAGSKFILEATSVRGGVEINTADFQLTVQKQTPQFVNGFVGSGGAKVTLWSQDGSIRVKKK